LKDVVGSEVEIVPQLVGANCDVPPKLANSTKSDDSSGIVSLFAVDEYKYFR
jgi:hypothetical protein